MRAKKVGLTSARAARLEATLGSNAGDQRWEATLGNHAGKRRWEGSRHAAKRNVEEIQTDMMQQAACRNYMRHQSQNRDQRHAAITL